MSKLIDKIESAINIVNNELYDVGTCVRFLPTKRHIVLKHLLTTNFKDKKRACKACPFFCKNYSDTIVTRTSATTSWCNWIAMLNSPV